MERWLTVQQARWQAQPSNDKTNSTRLALGCLLMSLGKVDSGNLARTLGFVSIWKREGTPSEPLSSLFSFQCPNLHLGAGDHLLAVLCSCLCPLLTIRFISEPSLHQPDVWVGSSLRSHSSEDPKHGYILRKCPVQNSSKLEQPSKGLEKHSGDPWGNFNGREGK